MNSGARASRLHGLDPVSTQQVMAAARALDAGRVGEADQHLAGALARQPQHAEVLRMQAGIQGMRGEHVLAIRTMQRALTQRPQDALYYNTLGTLFGNAGDFDAAIAALRRCRDLQPTLAMAWYNLGVMLTRCVRNEEAVAALRQAVVLAPDHMGARALLGDMLRTRGQVAAAAVEYRKVLAERPWTGMAWWGLADLKNTRFADDDMARMQAVLRHPEATNDDVIATGYALAKALDDADQPAQTLAALATAKAVAARRQGWDAKAFSAGVAAIARAFTATAQPQPLSPTLGEQAIFIVSLPRSGSTLVEQILASHSRVAGTGELPDLPLVLAEESRRRGMPFPQWVGSTAAADWERLGRRYLERTAHWRRQRPVFTDKLPNNWMYIDAIRAMLPGARIVCCRRDPLETCFSCYRQHLANSAYTDTFGDLASFWRDFDHSVRRARVAHLAQVSEHAYEDLLAQPEARIRDLLDFCGLPFEAACVQFHQTPREVSSPSATQVRQPLRQDTAHAPRYGALLDPLRAALGIPSWSQAR